MTPRPKRPTQRMIIKALSAVVSRDGPLPVCALQYRLWDKDVRVSRCEVVGALQSSQGRAGFSSFPQPLNGSRTVRLHYYLVDKAAPDVKLLPRA